MTASHFALPFRFVNGRPAINEQDSPDDIADCVEAVLRYPLGYRLEAPEFGISDQTFREGEADIAEIEEAIAEHEDRANAVVERLEAIPGDVDAAASLIRVLLEQEERP